MVTRIREIRCKIEIVIMTNNSNHEIIFNLDDYNIEMTVPDLLKKAEEWFKAEMEGL